MAKIYTRVHRLLRIISILQSKRGITLAEIATRCEVTHRTIYRDFDALQAAGISCTHNPETGGYHVARDFFMPPVELTFDESLALLVLAEHIAGGAQIPHVAPAARALEKIRAQLPAGITAELSRLDDHVEIHLASGANDESAVDVYDRVRKAIATSRLLLCKYDAASGAESNTGGKPFEFRPYALWYCHRAWYVVGLHGGRGALRSLKLSRFSEIKLTNKPYGIPDDFTLQKHLGNAWRMRGGKPHHIAIRFDPQFAETVCDTRWHHTQRIDDAAADGSVTLHFDVDGLDEIVWWVMAYGPHALVLEPKELAGRIADLSRATAARYA